MACCLRSTPLCPLTSAPSTHTGKSGRGCAGTTSFLDSSVIWKHSKVCSTTLKTRSSSGLTGAESAQSPQPASLGSAWRSWSSLTPYGHVSTYSSPSTPLPDAACFSPRRAVCSWAHGFCTRIMALPLTPADSLLCRVFGTTLACL